MVNRNVPQFAVFGSRNDGNPLFRGPKTECLRFLAYALRERPDESFVIRRAPQ